MNPNLANIMPLLGITRIQHITTFIIYTFQISVAYILLIRMLHIANIELLIGGFSIFIGIGAFVDQLVNPDENSTLGVIILFAVYYIIYKFVIFGLLMYIIFDLLSMNYEIHYLKEIIPGLIIFVFWAVGQYVGFYLQHRQLYIKAKNTGFDSLTDIDKLKIFLYQVGRRNFLRMLIQRKKAKFWHDESITESNPEEFQKHTRLVSLNMSNFLIFFKIKHLPESQYVAFQQIKEIDFSRNKIKKFSIALFTIFPQIERINLSNNKIKLFTDEQQHELVKIANSVEINLDGNPWVS